MLFVSCATKTRVNHKNEDAYNIINNELSFLTTSIEEGKVFLEKRFTDYLLWDFEDLEFTNDNYEYHFLTTFYSLSKEEFENIFNEVQINQYKKQVKRVKFIDSSKLSFENLTIINLEVKTHRVDFYNNKSLIVLSYPVFTKDKKYSLIRHYLGDFHRNSGNEVLSIYKKVNEKWVIFKRISLGIG